jgi:hypothetical protein
VAEFDVEQMLQRFRDRAAAVKKRPLPPVAGEERQLFIAQGTIEDGVLVLRVDLRGGSA